MTRLILEQSYVTQMSIHLDRFIWVPSVRAARFRCPICGDSKKNNAKTRGYIYINNRTRTHFSFKCFNCGIQMSFMKFLKEYFPSVYSQLRIDLLKEKGLELKEETPIIKRTFVITEDANYKYCLKDLPADHEAVKYCVKRQIPKEKFNKIFYVENFSKYVNSICAGKYEKLPEDKRIVFEFRDSNGKLNGVQGRILDEKTKKNRFLTLKFDDDSYKIYGLDSINKELPIIVTEGVIDSYFLDNAIAQTGGDVPHDLDKIIGVPKSNIYIVLDNEPRNKDTVHRMEVAINHGYKVHFWDVDSSLKDINDMVKAGINKEQIKKNILSNSIDGFKAKMKFHSWKKI